MAQSFGIAFDNFAADIDGLQLYAIYATRQLSRGVNRPPDRAYKHIATVQAADNPFPTAWDFTAEYNAAFGVCLSGRKIFVKVICISSGVWTGLSFPTKGSASDPTFSAGTVS